jgi:hypothetical protein
MPKYRVTVVEELKHVVDVEADTEDEAKQQAITDVCEDCEKHFMNVEDRYASFIWEVK